MAESVDLRALVEAEEQALSEEAGVKRQAAIRTSNEFKEQWRKIKASEQEQQRACAVSGQVAPLLIAADIPKDIGFYTVAYDKVPTGILRRRESLRSRSISVCSGWLLRETLEGAPVRLAKPRFRDDHNIYYGAAVDEKGELRVIDFYTSNTKPVGAREIDGLQSVHEVNARTTSNSRLSHLVRRDVDARLAEDRVLSIGPQPMELQWAEQMAEICQNAVPYMARLLILHNVELPASEA